MSSKKQSKSVVSKFFTSTKMDDSSNDFEEPKKYSGPKIMKAKVRTRKSKRIKGQSDIRKAVSNMNDLLSYTEEFNAVCVQSGVDMDAEHLQLAMVMSKSMHECPANDNKEAVETTSQERRSKIKATLLEYGFHVPDIKICKQDKRKRRLSKIKADSRLLNVSEEERQQIINDRFSQILMKLNKFTRQCLGNSTNEVTIVNLATNLPYNCMLNKCFFVEGIAEEVDNKIGGLLRDWSEIIGRPKSPTFTEPLDMEFTDVVYTQEELDTILSGKFNQMKVVIKHKQNFKDKHSITDHLKNTEENLTNSNQDVRDFGHTNEVVAKKVEPIRCLSPDIFDDELSFVGNKSLQLFTHSRSQDLLKTEQKTVSRMSMSQPSLHYPKNTMDKDCLFTNKRKSKEILGVDVTNRNFTFKPKSCENVDENFPLSQRTRRDSVLMDLTECLVVRNREGNNDVVNSQELLRVEGKTDSRISLLQPSLNYPKNTIDKACLATILTKSKSKQILDIDVIGRKLTSKSQNEEIQSRNVEQHLPLSQNSAQRTIRDSVLMDLTECLGRNKEYNKHNVKSENTFKNRSRISLSQPSMNYTKRNSHFMDLTECLQTNLHGNAENVILSQTSLQSTKRDNMFMDLTSCLSNNILIEDQKNKVMANVPADDDLPLSQRTKPKYRRTEYVVNNVQDKGVSEDSNQVLNKDNVMPKNGECSVLSQSTKIDGYIDLKQCISTNFNQKNDITGLKSNDFMELTECIKSSNQTVENIEPITEIDLTQNLDGPKGENTWKPNEFMDLTQSSDSNDSSPTKSIDGTKGDKLKTLGSNVSIFDDFNYTHSDDSTKSSTCTKLSELNEHANIDNSVFLESYVCNDKSFGLKNITKAPFQEFLNDIVPNNEGAVTTTQEEHLKTNLDDKFETTPQIINKSDLRLSQSPPLNSTSVGRDSGLLGCSSRSVYEDRDNFILANESSETPEKSILSSYYNNVTPTSIVDQEFENTYEDIENLGHSNGISIDYGELNDLINENSKLGDSNSQSYDKSDTVGASRSQSNVDENKSKDSKINENSVKSNRTKESSRQNSNCSEVFEISDEELDYSVQKSRCDNKGYISSDDSLPFIEIPGTRVKLKSPGTSGEIFTQYRIEEQNAAESGNKKGCVNENLVESINYKKYLEKSSETLLDEDIILVRDTKSDHPIPTVSKNPLYCTPIKDNPIEYNSNTLSPQHKTPEKFRELTKNLNSLPVYELDDSYIPIDDNHVIISPKNSAPKELDIDENLGKNSKNKKTPSKSRKTPKKQVNNPTSQNVTPVKQALYDTLISVQTPTSSDYIIKTRDVSPMLDYACMTTPERNIELDKFGIKPIKRKRAIQILEHIYNQTHPIVDATEFKLATKRIRLSPRTQMLTRNLEKPKQQIVPETSKTIGPSPKKQPTSKPLGVSPKKGSKAAIKVPSPRKRKNKALDIVDNEEFSIYEVTTEVPVLKEIYCESDDWILPKKERVKIKSCLAPLHIVFHNYVASRARLREAILCYKPVDIDIIHKQLVGYGYKFDAKELLKFLDKKCITVKTADNVGRNKKKSSQKQDKE